MMTPRRTTDTFQEIVSAATGAFATRAAAEGLVDVACARIATPLGVLLVAATDDGIVRVALPAEDHERVLAELAERISPRIVPHPELAVLGDAAAQLDDYFAGRLREFDLPLDLQLARGPYRRDVLAELRGIPFGQTRTYTQIADATGRPRAVRAVGSGCASNPVPLIVPCHRVLPVSGGLGGYLGGTAAKRWLLDHERAALVA